MSEQNGNGTAATSKAAAIRTILKKKNGLRLSAVEVKEAVKEQFGLDVSGPSVYQERRKINIEPADQAKTPAKVGVTGSQELQALLAVKELAGRLGGIDRLIELAEVCKQLVE